MAIWLSARACADGDHYNFVIKFIINPINIFKEGCLLKQPSFFYCRRRASEIKACLHFRAEVLKGRSPYLIRRILQSTASSLMVQTAVSPTRCPIKAEPIGELCEIIPLVGLVSEDPKIL